MRRQDRTLFIYKENGVEASKGFLIPMDADEVKVEPYDDEGGDGSMS